MVAREGFVYEQNPLSVTRNVVVWEGWSLVRVVVRQGFYCITIVSSTSFQNTSPILLSATSALEKTYLQTPLSQNLPITQSCTNLLIILTSQNVPTIPLSHNFQGKHFTRPSKVLHLQKHSNNSLSQMLPTTSTFTNTSRRSRVCKHFNKLFFSQNLPTTT